MKRVFALLLVVVLLMSVSGCGKARTTDERYESVVVDISSKDGGFYTTYADVEVNYYDGSVASVVVKDPTLLAFQVPDSYDGGATVLSGAEVNQLLTYINNGDTQAAKELLENLCIVDYCPT